MNKSIKADTMSVFQMPIRQHSTDVAQPTKRTLKLEIRPVERGICAIATMSCLSAHQIGCNYLHWQWRYGRKYTLCPQKNGPRLL